MENWRDKWADKLFASLLPALAATGAQVTPVLAKGPLADLVAQLQQDHGSAQIIDARRPKLESAQAASPTPRRWNLPGTVTAIAAMMGLVLEDAMLV